MRSFGDGVPVSRVENSESPTTTSLVQVLAQLQGVTPLPWEAGHASYSAILEKAGDYAGPLLKALNRDPAQRPSVTWITEQWRRVQDSERDPSPTGEFL